MSYHDLVPGARGQTLCAAILRAMTTAYTENAGRFAPEDLGDNNTTFGVSIVHNVRHLIELEVDGIHGVIARRAKNSFWLEIDGRPLYIYKAPPGQSTVHGMRFDESELRLQILEQNSEQLQFDFTTDAVAETEISTVGTPVLHPVVTHFGSPETGFDHAMIGAPYKTADGGCEWSWIEAFEVSAQPATDGKETERDTRDTADDQFDDLRMRDEETRADDDTAEGEA